MKQENKDLLWRYLSMALPYELKLQYQDIDYDFLGIDRGHIFVNIIRPGEWLPHIDIYEVKPYLRPMSSITLEEIEEFRHFKNYLRESECKIHIANYNQIQWLLEKHFDFMGLIPRDLAIEVTEENNPYK